MIDDNKDQMEIKTNEIETDEAFDDLQKLQNLDEDIHKNIVNDEILIDDAKELYALCLQVEHSLKSLFSELYSEHNDKPLTKFFNLKIMNINPINNSINKPSILSKLILTISRSCPKCKINIENSIQYADFGVTSRLFKKMEFVLLFGKKYKKLTIKIKNFNKLRNEIYHLRSEKISWKTIRSKTKIVKIPPEKQSIFNKYDWIQSLDEITENTLIELKNLRDKIRKLKSKE